jgi:hypothetical protein
MYIGIKSGDSLVPAAIPTVDGIRVSWLISGSCSPCNRFQNNETGIKTNAKIKPIKRRGIFRFSVRGTVILHLCLCFLLEQIKHKKKEGRMVAFFPANIDKI